MHPQRHRIVAGILGFFMLALLASASPVVTLSGPARKVLTPGGSSTLGVTASGSGPVTYQWRHKGQAIGGATGSTWAISNATPADSGWYVVDVTDSEGTTRSDPVFVTVAPAVARVRSWGDSSLALFSSPIGATDFIDLEARYWDALAIRRDGTITGWGYTNGHHSAPTGLSEIVSVSVGGHHLMALKSDGTVVVWGEGDAGQLDVPAGLKDVVEIAAGGYESLALRSDGTVVAWGNPGSGVPAIPSGLAGVTAIAAGNGFALALKADGTVVAWGYNYWGQCNVPAGLSGVVAIDAGSAHALALKSDGTVVAWGENGKNPTNVPAGLSDVIAVAAGGEHSMALKADGTVVCWGSAIYSETMVPADLGPVYSIAGGAYISLALDDGSTTLIAPTITQQPVNQTITGGEIGSFSVQATGSPFSYRWQILVTDSYGSQWYFYGDNDAGAQTNTLTVNPGWYPAIKQYRCIISNNAGSVTSDVVTLTVNAPPAPTIVSQPADQTVRPGQNAALSVSATSTGLYYQWRKNGVLLSDGANIAGATTATLAINNAQAGDTGSYYVVVTNSGGTVTSNAATLTVNSWPIVTSLGSSRHAVVSGQNVDLSVAATGTGPLGYQWTRNGRPIAGATESTLSLVGLTWQDSGYYHALVTDSNGTTRSKAYFVCVALAVPQVVGWGDNDHGQASVPAGLDDIVAVSAGDEFNLALRRGGMVVAWGDNVSGQCNVPDGLTDVVAVSAGTYHGLALRANGTVVAWGYNGNNQCKVPPWLGEVVAIAAGRTQSLALKANGTIVAWGDNYAGQTSGPEAFTDIVAIAAGSYHNLAIQADGTLVAWGQNYHGQTTVPAGLGSVAATDADGLSLVLKTDGTVVAWPAGGYGAAQVPANLSGVTGVAAGSRHSLALKPDGTLVGWGVGVAATIPPLLNRVIAVSAGGDHAIALRDGTPDVAPAITTHPVNQMVAAGQTASFSVTATGTTPAYQWRKGGSNLTNSARISGATGATLTITGVTLADAGSYDVVVANTGGTATSEVAILTLASPPTITSTPDPRQIGVPGQPLTLVVTATSANGSLSYQWKKNNRPIPGATSPTYSPGNFANTDAGAYTLEITNVYGQVGRTTTFVLPAYPPTQVRIWGGNDGGQLSVPGGLSNAVAMSSGRSFVLALKANGTLAEWGGNGDTQFQPPADLSEVVAISAGNDHALALKADGTVVAWGYNLFGQTSVPAGLSGVIAVAAGEYFSLALGSDGKVTRWGQDTDTFPVPANLSGVTAIAAGGRHAQALKLDGTVLGWGGILTAPAGLTNAVAVAAGRNHALALRADGTVVAWGNNTGGQITVPAGLTDAIAISSAENVSFALKADGTVVAWGNTASTNGPDVLPNDLSGALALASGPVSINAMILRDATGDTPPAITVQPVGATITVGQTATLSVTATGSSLSYQWRKDGSNLVDVGTYTGAGSATLTIPNAQTGTTGSYDVVVSNALGSSPSVPATLIVQERIVITLQNAARQVLAPGESVSLGVMASGAGSLRYQWMHNGRPVAGATGSSLTLTNVSRAANGYYFVDVADDFGTRRSATYFVLVAPVSTRVVGFGSNGYRQTQIPADLTDAVAIVAGNYRSFAILRNGTVRVWGSDSDVLNAPPAGLTDVVAVAAGYYSTLVLKSDGTVVGWSLTTNMPADLTNVVAVSAADQRFLALKSDGSVVVWDVFKNGPTPLQPPTGLKAVGNPSIGVNHAVAVKDDGTVAAWGASQYGQTDVPVGLTDAVQLAAGSNHSLAVRSTGEVAAWGFNLAGQTSVPAGLSGVVAVAAGGSHSLALKSDGTVVAWGGNTYGETLVPSSLGDVFAIAAGSVHSLALREWVNDTPLITSQPSARYVFVPDTAVFSVAANGLGVLTYQWQRLMGGTADWSDLSDGGVFSGVTTAMLQVGPTTLAMDGETFRCVVRNSLGSVTSEPAPLGAMPWSFHAPSVSLGVGLQRRVGQTLIITLNAGDPNGDFSFANLWIRTPDGNWRTLMADGSTVPSHDLSSAHAIITEPGTFERSFTFTPADGAGTYTIAAAAMDASGLRADASIDVVVEPNRAPTASFFLSGHHTIGESIAISFNVDDADGNYAFANLRVNTPNRGWLTIRSDNSIAISGDITASNNSALVRGYGMRNFALTATDGPGVYSFTLTAVDSLGERVDSPTQTVTVVVSTTGLEAWRTANFTTAELIDANLSGPNADPDHDGLGNLLEYALGLEPRTANTAGLPGVSTAGPDWVYTYTRPSDRTDVIYMVEVSFDLVSWTATGVSHERVSSAGGVEMWQGRYPLASTANVFFRLKVMGQ